MVLIHAEDLEMLIARAAAALVSTILVAFNVGMPTGPVDNPLSACSFRVVGHRGTEAGVARNNTVAAFRQAVADGADVIEMDLRRTAPDDQGHPTWVVNHDATIRGHRISRTTFQTLKDLQPDLATFSEAAQVAAGAGVGIEVELKPERVSTDGLREALGVLTTMQLRETAVLTSAHRSVLAQLKPIAGPTQLGLIVREPADLESVKKLADRVLIRHNLITAEYVAAAHAHDLLVEVWTVDDPDGWHTFSRNGVDGVITDKAAALNAWCASEYSRATTQSVIERPTEDVGPTGHDTSVTAARGR
jgi:glycerophosphoryl diester phosphodiesterase